MPAETTACGPARRARTPREKARTRIPRLGIVALPVVLAACGLPPAVTVASLVADAFSLAVSEKTVTDHAISEIAQKDCAVWRGLTGDGFCTEEDGTVAVASKDGHPAGAETGASAGGDEPRPGDTVAVATESDPAEPELTDLALSTASAEPGNRPEPAMAAEPRPARPALKDLAVFPARPPAARRHEPVPVTVGFTPAPSSAGARPSPDPQAAPSRPVETELKDLAIFPSMSSRQEPAPARFITASASAGRRQAAPPSTVVITADMPATTQVADPAPAGQRTASGRDWVVPATVGPDMYFVIASLSRWAAAAHVAQRYRTLGPSVVTATLDGRRVFRVVIGPCSPGEQDQVLSRIHQAGIRDAWPVRMNSAAWFGTTPGADADTSTLSVAELAPPPVF